MAKKWRPKPEQQMRAEIEDVRRELTDLLCDLRDIEFGNEPVESLGEINNDIYNCTEKLNRV